ncbi:MAG: L-seryl-tRNA(Sec) selenium transferase [Frankiaceae bacterium]
MSAPDVRRRVPRTDAVLADPRLVAALDRFDRTTVKAAVAAAQKRARQGEVAPEDVPDEAARALPPRSASLCPVINATGVVLHTNLGRAPLSPAARDALQDAAGYVDVEFDVATGTRATRGRGALEVLRRAVPDAGDALVVNNGAAALVLAVTALAAGREVLVSRGELIEIGDGFRLPDLVISTGARIREVGTTNRTYLRDYADAVGPDTAAVLKVHPSNFRSEGFVAHVGVAELTGLGAPVVVDIGSGLLAPDPLLPSEPDAASTLRAGADLVTASGDKLLGGPQAGLILGGASSADLVDRLRRHPLARAVRVDKLTLAAFEATLRSPATPTYQALHADPALLRARAEALAVRVRGEPVPSGGAVGGGGAPGLTLAGWAVAMPVAYAQALRQGEPCVVGRIERDRCLLDLRCVPAERDDELAVAVEEAAPRCT